MAGDEIPDRTALEAVVVNIFDGDSASARYAAGRPDVHGVVVALIGEMIGTAGPIGVALDVGCGTGLSTRALRSVAEMVVGADAGMPMLRRAREHGDGRYVQAVAEDLPFRGNEFGLVTVSCAFHWFDRDRFVAEAARVLHPGGWLAIYSCSFQGDMSERSDFRAWLRDTYIATYPNPPRHKRYSADEVLDGFEHVETRSYDLRVALSKPALVTYLLSQSNLNVAIADGAITEDALRAWLHAELAPFYASTDTGSFLFGGTISCLRRL